MSDISYKKIRPSWTYFLFVFLFIGSIIALFIFYSFAQIKRVQTIYGNGLTVLAELKASQIDQWRTEILVDAGRILSDAKTSSNIESLIASPGDSVLLFDVTEWMRNYLKNPNFSSAYLLDATGKQIVRVDSSTEKPGILQKENALESIRTGQPILSDLYSVSTGSVYMDLAVPITGLRESQKVIAVVVLQINPDAVLFPLIETFPTAFITTETLLVRKEGDEVVYLNRLKYIDNLPLKLRFPISNESLPGSMAVNDITGIVEGVDYRNVKVTAVIIPVNGTNWKLIAKIDRSEIYSSVKFQGWVIGGALVLVIIAICFGLDYLWRRQSVKYYKNLYENELERSNLEHLYTTLFNQASDVILFMDETGRIIDVNDKAEKVYGYSRNEFLKMNVTELRDASTQAWVEMDMQRVKDGIYNSFETIHKDKSGSAFHVEVSCQYLQLGEKGYFQSLIRNISERKEAELKLRQSELELKKAQEVAHVGSWSWDISANHVECSDETLRILGLNKIDIEAPFNEIIKKFSNPDNTQQIEQFINEAINKKQKVSCETHIIRLDGTTRDIKIGIGEIILGEDGKVVSLSGIIQDITEKKIAEKEIQKREKLLSKIIEILPVGLEITDKSGKIIQTNKALADIWGKELLSSQDEMKIFHGRRLLSNNIDQPDDWASSRTINEGLTITGETIEIETYDEQIKTILNYSTPLLDENNEITGAIVVNLDITELKKAEELLTEQLDELRRWNLATLGREKRIIELKKEVNTLLQKMDLPPRYTSLEDLQE